MRKVKKFAKGGGTSRADAMRDRRMADIESDYKKAIARGVPEKEARAKRAQREADARDDYAKRTGADRTQTRAAERAAETRLSAARRSPDKDMKPVSVASEGPSRKPLVDTSVKADIPSPGAAKPAAATPKPTAPRATRRVAPKPAAAAPKPAYRASFGKPAAAAPKPAAAAPKPAAAAKPKSVGRQMMDTYQSKKQARLDELGRDLGRVGEAVSWFFAGKNRDKKAKGGKVKGYAKGGKIDGAAIRGKTRAKRNK